MKAPITIQATVKAPLDKVWAYWNDPEHIGGWAFAQDDWMATGEHNDVKVGGTFKTVMAARDGSVSFDFEGTYTDVEELRLLEYDMSDGRHVRVEFAKVEDGVHITETFDPEDENPVEMQRDGWQAILDNFKAYAERSSSS